MRLASLIFMKRAFLLLLLALGTGAGVTAAHACPGCTSSVAVGAGQSSEVLAGFSWSVLFLLAAVLSGMGGLGAVIARACRRLDRERQSPVARS